MDIYETRRQAVLNLIAGRRFGGSRAAFSRETGINQSYVTRMLKPIGEKGGKRIADSMAIKIEDQLGLASGSIHSPDLPPPPPDHRSAELEFEYQNSRSIVSTLGVAIEVLAGALTSATPLSRKGAAPVLSSLAEHPEGWMQVASLLSAMLKPRPESPAKNTRSIRPAPKPARVKATPAARGHKSS